ncbi:hypothetical protein GCM10007939_06590 [Amylibacter marinus]|uniref:Amidinotransferase n=1 Tax=Amylibacter marinus TaxID=1475483 RepID=A0ABQ5VSW1_9RHOB|nr:hypothetical protein GCM10007939_06590 [Amylibacter marinus]
MLNSLQAPRAVLMVRPHQFTPNAETAADNAFQTDPKRGNTSAHALAEFDGAVARLRAHGVRVHVFDDTGAQTPDSVFPNNWISTHSGGQVALYPMYAPSRRRERRADVLDMLKVRYRVENIIDYSGLEQDDLFLEGTGAMVLDHIGRIAYTAKSNRADPLILERFATHFSYEPIMFDAVDPEGRAIYHTNVLMCVATNFALIGLSLISDPDRRATVVRRLEETGRDVIELSFDQIASFAGNAIELTGSNGHILVLSTTALNSLNADQKARIERHATLVPVDVPTIEHAGGSARCMIASIHLTARPRAGEK